MEREIACLGAVGPYTRRASFTSPENPFMATPTIDVVGIGNAIVDVLSQADDSFIQQEKLAKGTMALIDEAQATTLYGKMKSGIEASGGSAANTIAGVASLGGKAAYIGKVPTISSARSSPMICAQPASNTIRRRSKAARPRRAASSS